jgi:hypothetical protein
VYSLKSTSGRLARPCQARRQRHGFWAPSRKRRWSCVSDVTREGRIKHNEQRTIRSEVGEFAQNNDAFRAERGRY